MGLRVSKRVKLASGVWVNLGKTGLTISVGLRDYGIPLTTNISRSAAHVTISAVGTGLSWRQRVVDFRPKKKPESLRKGNGRATGSGNTDPQQPVKRQPVKQEPFIMSSDTCAVCGSPLSTELSTEDVVLDLGMLGKKTVKDVPVRTCSFPKCSNKEHRIQAFPSLLNAVASNMMAKRFELTDGKWKAA